MKIIKTVLLATLALLLLLVVALVAAVNLIDLNKQKDRIARLVYEETGRELQIIGDLEWGLWPRLRLAGGPITLGNAPGFGPEPMLSLESFQFAVATWPLTRSELLLDMVRVSGLHLNLARNAAGIGNWEDLVAAEPQPGPPPPKAAKSDTLPFAALALGGVHIDDLRISWHDELSGQQAEIYNLRLLIGALSFGEPIGLDLTFQARANQPELSAASVIKGTLTYDLRNGIYSLSPLTAAVELAGPTVPGGKAAIDFHTLLELDSQRGQARIEEFRLAGLGMEIRTRMEMDNLNAPLPDCRGEFQAEIADLVRLLETFQSPLGRQLAGVEERTVTLHSEFSAEPAWGRVQIPRLEARILGTEISAHLAAEELDSPQPRVAGAFKAVGPDLPALLAVAARLAGADPTEIPGAVSGLRERGLLLEAEFGSEEGEITIPRLRARGLATSLESDWRLRDPVGDRPGLQGMWQISGDNLPMLLRVAAVFAGGGEKGRPDAEASPDPARELRALATRVTRAGHQKFNLGSELVLDQASGRAQIKDLRLAALGLGIQANLQTEQLEPLPIFQLHLELDPMNPRALMELLDLPVPETTDRQALTRLALTTTISGSPEKFQIRPLDLRLDGSRLSGEVRVNDLEKADVGFNLAIDQLDLDRYLPPETEAAPATPETAAVAATQLPVEMLRELLVEGELKIADLKASGLKVQNFLLGINAAGGLIQVQPLQAELYGGKMAGGVELDARGSEPLIKTTNRISGVQAGPLLRDLTGEKELIRGRAEIDYQLETRGAEVEAMKGHLNGTAAFGFHDGAVVGVNIGLLLRQAGALAQGRPPATAPQELTTDFSELTGTAQIQNGLVSNRDLSLKSPLLRLNGQGSAHLVSEQVDYLLTATVAATAEGQQGRGLEELRGLTVPIRVSGSFSELSFRPELTAANLEQLGRNLRELGRAIDRDGLRVLEGILAPPASPAETEKGAPAKPEEQLEEQLKDELRRLFRF
ncbi:AsmA family protein [Desulfurivibrio sp. D14AmB]|uniref:AsmA family protein n=1 Tax=Desulfurivibrio sp. D14AmB TaxID=3374370 RepID=UPI00376F1CD1